MPPGKHWPLITDARSLFCKQGQNRDSALLFTDFSSWHDPAPQIKLMF